MLAIRFLIPLLMCCFVLPATGQDAGVWVGETQFFPSLTLEFGQSDNAFRRDNDEAVDEEFVIVSPRVEWKADKGVTDVEVSYQGAFKVGSVEETDSNSSSLAGKVSTEFSRRSRLEAEAILSLEFLELGDDVFTRVDPDAFDQVELLRQSIDVSYTFGAAQARGQIVGNLEINNLDFLNNDDVTDNSGRLVINPSVDFAYRASPDSRVFLTVGIRDVTRSGNGLDRTDLDLGVGSRWDITDRTGGFAQIGVTRAALDGADDTTEVTLDAGLYFRPRSFSRFDVAASRRFFNDGVGTLSEAAVISELSVNWRHDWSSRVYHIARVAYDNVDRTCPDLDQDTVDARLEVGFQVRRWISFGFGGEIESRTNSSCPEMVDESTLPPDFDKQGAFAFLRLSL